MQGGTDPTATNQLSASNLFTISPQNQFRSRRLALRTGPSNTATLGERYQPRAARNIHDNLRRGVCGLWFQSHLDILPPRSVNTPSRSSHCRWMTLGFRRSQRIHLARDAGPRYTGVHPRADWGCGWDQETQRAPALSPSQQNTSATRRKSYWTAFPGKTSAAVSRLVWDVATGASLRAVEAGSRR